MAWLAAASCTTGWSDWEHGSLWVAPDGLARSPAGWQKTVVHTFQGVDPANWKHAAITMSELQRIVAIPITLWLPADRIQSAALHRGLLNDRLMLTMADAKTHKLLWVRDKVATGRVE
jgi:hypothetical protein